MKNKKITLQLAMMLFLFSTACTKTSDSGGITEIYRYVNESGVEVALVGERQGRFVIPDSLVLQNGESFECSAGFNGDGGDGGMSQSFPYKEGEPGALIPLKIYFNKTVRMTYYAENTGKNSRNPFLSDNAYVKTWQEKKHKKEIEIINTYTYTFTAEDYQNALAAQK